MARDQAASGAGREGHGFNLTRSTTSWLIEQNMTNTERQARSSQSGQTFQGDVRLYTYILTSIKCFLFSKLRLMTH